MNTKSQSCIACRLISWLSASLVLISVSISNAADVTFTWEPGTDGNWSDTTKWSQSFYPDNTTGVGTNDTFSWVQSDLGTATLTIDVADAGLTRLQMSGFNATALTINSSDQANNKLTFNSQFNGSRAIWATSFNHSITINADIVNTASPNVFNFLSLGGGWENASRVFLNGVISGEGSVTYKNVGGNDSYSGSVVMNAANTYTGKTSWYDNQFTTRRFGDLNLENTHALQNSTLDVGAVDVGSTTAENGAVRFNATGTHVVGGLEGGRALDLNGKTVNFGNNNANTSYSGILSNGSLGKIGAGTLTLTGASTYNGATSIEAGSLALSGSASINNTSGIAVASGAVFDVSALGSAFTLQSGQVLSGNGNVTGDMVIASGAELSPGNSIGALTIGNTTLLDGAIINFEFENVGSFDQLLAATGTSLTLDLGALITINVSNLGTGTISLGDSFVLYDGEVTGFAGASFNIVNNSNWAGGFEVTEGSLILTAIPEPSSMALLAGLAASLFLGLRRCGNR